MGRKLTNFFLSGLLGIFLSSDTLAWERLGDVLPYAPEPDCFISDAVMANTGATVGVSYTSGVSMVFGRSGDGWLSIGNALDGSILSIAKDGLSMVTTQGVFIFAGSDWEQIASKEEGHSADGKTAFRVVPVNTYEVLKLNDGVWEIAEAGPQGCQGQSDCDDGEGCSRYCVTSISHTIKAISGDGETWVIKNSRSVDAYCPNCTTHSVGDWTLASEGPDHDPSYLEFKAMSYDGSRLAFTARRCDDIENCRYRYETHVFDAQRNTIGIFEENAEVVALTSQIAAVYQPFPHLHIKQYSAGDWITKGYSFDTSNLTVEAISEAGDLVLLKKDGQAWVCGLQSAIDNSAAESQGACDEEATGGVISHPRWIFELVKS